MLAIKDFISSVNKYEGFAKSHLFVVMITPPRILQSQGLSIAKDIQFFCDTAALPGISLATTDVRHYNYGPTERKPFSPVFIDTNMTFMLDNKGEILKFFHLWLQSITNFNGGAGIGSKSGGVGTFEVQYADEYQTTITILQYNQHETEVISYKLFNAYPLTLNDVPLSWVGTGDVARLQVPFTYRSWQSSKMQANAPNQISSNLVSTLGLTKDSAINYGTALGLTQQPIATNNILQSINSTQIF